MLQRGWTETPHKPRTKRKSRTVPVYYRGWKLGCRRRVRTGWTVWRRYRDQKTAIEAIKALRRSYEYSIIGWQFALLPETNGEGEDADL